MNAGKAVRFFDTAAFALAPLKASCDEMFDRNLAGIEKSDLLILDEFGCVLTDLEGAWPPFQTTFTRYERQSLILTINIELSK